jgi:macrolide transport system ATP-binding/permease protein
MLNVNNLSKSYGLAAILHKVTFSLSPGVRAGLVGTNGVGKSTLLKILAGQETADSGQIVESSSQRISYLPQSLSAFAGQTIDDLFRKAAGELRELESRVHLLEAEISRASDEGLPRLMEQYSEAADEFRQRGGYDLDHRVEGILADLGIGYLERSRNIDTLSGGEKTRVSLATILLTSPDILLLDEPTNNLDLASLEWIERYLVRYPGAMLIASHDRQFLNNVVNVIFEIDEHSHELKKYAGDYDAYKAAKVAERAKWEEEYRTQQEEISELKRRIKTTASNMRNSERRKQPRDNDKFVLHFKEQHGIQKASSHTIRTARERLERIEADPIPRPPRPLRFKTTFSLQSINSAEVIRALDICKSFGSHIILDGLTFTFGPDSRIVIIGPNGAGKTTLLNILAGQDTAYDGKVNLAPSVRIGFLPQEPEFNQLDRTVLQYYGDGLLGHEDDFVFGLVTCGLFRYDELNKKVGQLSLGQMRKLQIGRMVAAEPNVLILDEPTNHISLDVLESFESAIADFPGPVIAVSHDRRFIQQFGKEIWELNEGKLIIHHK